jgi:ATP-binding cassette subfamily F protein uup
MDFPGCLVVVSHDRYFMDKIVDHLFVFRGHSVIDDFPGNYSDFRSYEASTSKVKKIEANDHSKPKNDWKSNNDKAKLNYNEQKEYTKLEREIAKLEKERESLQNKFATENWSGDEINKQSKKLQDIIDNVDQKTGRYFELSEKLEA